MSSQHTPGIFSCKVKHKPTGKTIDQIDIIERTKSNVINRLNKRFFLKEDEEWEIQFVRKLKGKEIPRSWVPE